MQKLLAGYRRFRSEVYPARSPEFSRMEKGQQPETLLITCSDSRIVPDLLLQTQPGQLFICRNAGNIVPAYGDHTGGVSATIEYAVRVLKVSDIVICGHSDCGVMHGLLYPERVARLKCVTDWLSYGERAKAVAEHIDGFDQMTDAEKAMALARENVLAQVDNLKTHPSVAAELSRGSLSLHAWMFEIHNGELLAWNSETGRFAPLETVSDNVPAVSAAQ